MSGGEVLGVVVPAADTFRLGWLVRSWWPPRQCSLLDATSQIDRLVDEAESGALRRYREWPEA